MIGLLAGSGKLPVIFLENAKKHNREVVCIAVKGEAGGALKKYTNKIYYEKAENLGRIIEILKNENVRELIMLGKYRKFNFFKGFKPDERVKKILASLKDKNDITLLKALISEFEKEGIKIAPSILYMEDLLARKGILTKRRPSQKETEDINFGINKAKKLADSDIGQTIIVKDKIILAVEAVEGTDAAIKRGGYFGKTNSVCIKTARTKQDLRMDVPVIGSDTIKVLKKSGITCLAIEANKMIIIDEKEVIKLAERFGISIISL